ncbi:hypothetical protein D917_06256 [Trichinella nativa]|uniref:Uncharacterized protein n=1 Tax=Trichinella nativa TaxID=6335 RepID=A0A1Y3E6K1_9BILA|nr:hypothetical protein D917_06256 [Trichinella nativa]
MQQMCVCNKDGAHLPFLQQKQGCWYGTHFFNQPSAVQMMEMLVKFTQFSLKRKPGSNLADLEADFFERSIK